MLNRLLLVSFFLAACGSGGNSNGPQEGAPDDRSTPKVFTLISDKKINAKGTTVACNDRNIVFPKADQLNGSVYLLRIGLQNPELAKSDSVPLQYAECIQPTLETLIQRD